MPIPDYQSIMLPLLLTVADGKEYLVSDLVRSIGVGFNLSDDEFKELLPSGREPRFRNRVGWTLTYFKKALLLKATGRAKVVITDRGKELLNENPPRIKTRDLYRYPEFVEFQKRSKSPVNREDGHIEEVYEEQQTPEEALESSYSSLRRNLESELLDRIKSCSPRFFELLVVDLLVAMGYGGSRKDAGQAIGQSGDGGIDGIIKEDRLGLDAVYIQAKRWESNIGRPVVQTFAGSLEGQRARKGVLITTSKFSDDAKRYVTNIEKKIVLIDGELLAQYMVDFNIGVAEVANYTVKKIDVDYFEE
jgi:restriction system protein